MDKNKGKTDNDNFFLLMFEVCFGTVFQTAFLLAFIVPRLRPGLLSLRSV